MGGDDAPLEIVRGGVEYARETGRTVLLVGQEEPVRAAVDEVGAPGLPVEIVPASEVIAFDEKVASVRSKPDASIRVGLQLVKEGRACGFVSAGHTGAMMALSRMVLRRIAGVDRPALPAPLPKRKGGHTILLDLWASKEGNRRDQTKMCPAPNALFARHDCCGSSPSWAPITAGPSSAFRTRGWDF